METRHKVIAVALLALALMASACGSDSDGDSAVSAADQEVIDAVAQQLREGDGAPESVDIDCMAAALVNGMGGAEAMATNHDLTAAAIIAGEDPTDVELASDQAIALADDAIDCGLANVILDGMTSDGMPEDAARCLFDNLDQDAVRDMLAADFMSDADAAVVGDAAEDTLLSSMFGAVAECDIDPSALGL